MLERIITDREPIAAARFGAGTILAALVLLAGCAPSLATFMPSRLTPAGHLQVTTAVEGTITDGPIREAIDEVQEIGGGGFSEEDVDRAADAATAVLVQPPAIGYQIGVAYGVSRRFELSVRSSMSAIRAGFRFQFLRAAPGIYGAIGVFGTYHLYGFPIGQFTDRVDVSDFSRVDLDIPLSLGYSGRYVHFWAGPKLVFSSYDATFTLCMQRTSGACTQEATGALGGTAAYLGGQVGLALGYSSFWVAAEMTVMHVGVSADVDVTTAVGAASRRYGRGGTVLSPSLGVIMWF